MLLLYDDRFKNKRYDFIKNYKAKDVVGRLNLISKVNKYRIIEDNRVKFY